MSALQCPARGTLTSENVLYFEEQSAREAPENVPNIKLLLK